MTTAVHVLVFDGFADWEPALALAELRRTAGLDVLAVGFGEEAATSMGGLRVAPHRALGDVDPDEVRLFLVPGGDMWEDERRYPRAALDALLLALAEKGVPVAGICAGTIALARAGLLDARAHTSNYREYLTANAPAYAGADRYVEALAARDRRVITASGLGYVEFAREIFAELDVMTADDRARWFHMYRTGEWREPAAS
jgi:putative intracellular protease/amidase